jgi:N-acetylglucosaminyldiphosphoundecaprenol N-acetyl-beta-D-mannosaminyltransferase
MIAADFPTFNVLGVDVAAVGMEDVLRICRDHIERRASLLLGVVNAAKLVNSRKDSQLADSLAEADIVVADGLPVVWLGRMTGRPLPERIAGIDLMNELLACADTNGYRVFFLGARPEVVEKVVEVVKKRHPGLTVAGYRDGYFESDLGGEVAEQIRQSRADMLFVAMSSPAKENFLRRWRSVMDVPVCHGVGGTFDVIAGVARRAPAWMQKAGLEWFYRFLQEPRRMWKRYLVTNSIFLKLAAVEIARSAAGRLHLNGAGRRT